LSIEEKDTGSFKTSATDLRSDLIIGMSDGLIIPFAIVAGMSSVEADKKTLVITCITAILIGAVAMGRGGYRAAVATMSSHPGTRDLPMQANTEEDKEIKKTKAFLANLGLNEEMQAKAVADIVADRQQWNEFVEKHELHHNEGHPQHATRSAVTIAIAYFLGGLIPLLPYFFFTSTSMALKIAAPITILFLAVLGFLKNKLLSLHPIAGAIRMALIGALAAGAAFFVARLFD
jgi:VIT1/CCC1 family predicted Fe2+/Mn2+ transporter